MKDVVKTMLEHPFATVFLIGALGHAISAIFNGGLFKPIEVRISNSEE